MLSVGEPSGDLHAARLLEQLNLRNASIHCFGMGGARMRKQGFEAVVGIEQMAVMGLFEIIRHFPTLYGVLRKMRQLLQQRRPDLLILVDYPGFNLWLAKHAKKLGIPVLYYISPKIWVWRERRIHKIAARVDQMALIFPFELPYYRRVGVPATYVGHPLVGKVICSEGVKEARSAIGLDPERVTIGLFPGSRRGEVVQLLPELLESARQMSASNPALQFILSQAPELPAELFTEGAELVASGAISMKLLKGEVYRAIRASDAIVTASGTVTLEMALLGTPMVVIYRMAPFSYAILSRLIKIPYVSLVNIVAGREVVPELLQEEASAESIIRHLSPLLVEGIERRAMVEGLSQVRTELGEGSSAERLSDLVEEMLGIR